MLYMQVVGSSTDWVFAPSDRAQITTLARWLVVDVALCTPDA